MRIEFIEDGQDDSEKVLRVRKNQLEHHNLNGGVKRILVRSDGNLKELGYYLGKAHKNWRYVVVTDDLGCEVLVRVRKDGKA